MELKKFNANQVETEDQRWLKFFKDGERLNDEALPDWMITQQVASMKQRGARLSIDEIRVSSFFSIVSHHYFIATQTGILYNQAIKSIAD